MTDYEKLHNATEVAGEIASALGEGWSMRPGSWQEDRSATIVGPDDIELFMRTEWFGKGTGRWEIRGSLPDGWFEHRPGEYGDNPRPVEITVARSKAGHKIAAEIQRRLLPGHMVYLEAARQNKIRSERHTDAVRQLGERIIAAAPGAAWVKPYQSRNDDRPTEIRLGRAPESMSGRIRVQSDSVTFEDLRMSADDAVAFAEWAATRGRKE